MNSGKLSLKDIRTDLLGGHHAGNWDVDFTATPPKYFGSGTVTKIAMAQVAALMHDAWATGSLDGQYTLGIAGLMRQHCVIPQQDPPAFKWTGGSLRHVDLDAKSAPLTFSSFGGQIALQNGTITCQGCKLLAGSESYEVTGNASFEPHSGCTSRKPRTGSSYAISGPLEKPDVVTVPAPSSEAKVR